MTKALQLARSFHRAGHRVVLVESAKYRLTGHRFSRAVDRFYTVPEAAGPRLRRRAAPNRARRRASTSTCRSAARWPATTTLGPRTCSSEHCEVLHVDAGHGRAARRQARVLQARRLAGASGARLAPHHRPAAGRRVRLRADERAATSSRASRTTRSTGWTSRGCPATRARATADFVDGLPISRDNPWIMQAFVDRTGVLHPHHGARRACSSCTAAASRRRSRSTTRWSTSRRSRRGCRRFVGALKLTGQVSFDFIETDDGSRLRDRVQPAHALGHHDVLRPSRTWRSAYLESGVAEVKPLTLEPADVLALPRAVAVAGAADDAAGRGGGPSRAARTRSSTGRIRCRS